MSDDLDPIMSNADAVVVSDSDADAVVVSDADAVVVYHLADIHLQNTHAQAIEQAVEQVADHLKNDSAPNKLVLIAGDIFHEKVRVSAAAVKGFVNMLRKLSPWCKEIVTMPGNHDCPLNNLSFADLISPLADLTGKGPADLGGLPHNFKHLAKTGSYEVEGFDTTVNIVHPGDIDLPAVWPVGPTNINILMLHEDICGSMYSNNDGSYIDPVTLEPAQGEPTAPYTLDGRIKPSYFSQYNAVMVGHIHEFTAITDKAAYSGALVQQTIGESFTKGYIRWVLTPQATLYKFVPITVPGHAFMKIHAATPSDHLQINGKLTLGPFMQNPSRLELQFHCADDSLQTLVARMRERFQIEPTILPNLHIPIIGAAADADSRPLNIEEQNDQLVLMKKVLDRFPEYQTVKEDILTSHRESLSQPRTHGTGRFTIQYMEWSNMLCFGAGPNYIDFTTLQGRIVGIVAENRMGKSSIVDILIYALYGTESRGNLSNMLNIHSSTKSGYVKITFCCADSSIHIIERKCHKNKSATLLYTINGVNSAEETSKATQAKINRSIGNREDCLATVITSQERAFDFLDLSNKARYEELYRILGINIFEERAEDLRKELCVLKGQLKLLQEANPKTADMLAEAEAAKTDLETEVAKAEEIKKQPIPPIPYMTIKYVNNELADLKRRISEAEVELVKLMKMEPGTMDETDLAMYAAKPPNEMLAYKARPDETPEVIRKWNIADLGEAKDAAQKRIQQSSTFLVDYDLGTLEKNLAKIQNRIGKNEAEVKRLTNAEAITQSLQEYNIQLQNISDQKRDYETVRLKLQYLDKKRQEKQQSQEKFIAAFKRIKVIEQKLGTQKSATILERVHSIRAVTAFEKMITLSTTPAGCKSCAANKLTIERLKREAAQIEPLERLYSEVRAMEDEKARLTYLLTNAGVDTAEIVAPGLTAEAAAAAQKKEKAVNDKINELSTQQTTIRQTIQRLTLNLTKVQEAERQLAADRVEEAQLLEKKRFLGPQPNKEDEEAYQELIRKYSIKRVVLWAAATIQLQKQKINKQIKELNEKYADLEEKRADLVIEWTAYQIALTANEEAAQTIATNTVEILKMAHLIEKLKADLVADAEYKRLKHEIFLKTGYKACLDRNGIQQIILDSNLATINDVANTFLNSVIGNELRINMCLSQGSSMIDIKMLQQGGKPPAPSSVASAPAQEAISLSAEQGSGFQKFIMSLALRVAFARICRAALPDILIIDEGFGCLDECNITRVVNTLPNLTNICKNVLVITHLQTLQTAFDLQIHIRLQNERSILQYGQTAEVQPVSAALAPATGAAESQPVTTAVAADIFEIVAFDQVRCRYCKGRPIKNTSRSKETHLNSKKHKSLV